MEIMQGFSGSLKRAANARKSGIDIAVLFTKRRFQAAWNLRKTNTTTDIFNKNLRIFRQPENMILRFQAAFREKAA